MGQEKNSGGGNEMSKRHFGLPGYPLARVPATHYSIITFPTEAIHSYVIGQT